MFGSYKNKLRKEKEIIKYLDEAFDKVWFMRTHPCDNKEIEEKRLKAIERIINKYQDIPNNGYSDWDCGYWNGVLGTLRWVLGEEEKNMLDT